MDHERDELSKRREARSPVPAEPPVADAVTEVTGEVEAAIEVFQRAAELERVAGRAMPSDATLADALAVLERHGEEPPVGLDTEAVLKVPASSEIGHKSARIITDRTAWESAPPDVKAEDKVARWATSLYQQAMFIAAAGVFRSTGSLDTAASVLWWANFSVQAGYFPEGHEGENLDLDDEEALRLWVEGEQENIMQAVDSQGLYLAGTGRLMDEVEE